MLNLPRAFVGIPQRVEAVIHGCYAANANRLGGDEKHGWRKC